MANCQCCVCRKSHTDGAGFERDKSIMTAAHSVVCESMCNSVVPSHQLFRVSIIESLPSSLPRRSTQCTINTGRQSLSEVCEAARCVRQ